MRTKIFLIFVFIFSISIAHTAEEGQSYFEKIKKLTELKSQGKMTQEKFENEQAKLKSSFITTNSEAIRLTPVSKIEISQKTKPTKIEKGISLDDAIALLGEPTNRLITSSGKGLLHFISYDDKVFLEYDSKSKVIVNWFGSYKHSVLKKFFISDSSANFADPLYRTQTIDPADGARELAENARKMEKNSDTSSATAPKTWEFYDLMQEFGISKRAAITIANDINSQGLRGKAAKDYASVIISLYLKENGRLP